MKNGMTINEKAQRIVLGCVVLALLVPAGTAFATKDCAEKLEMACTACHDKPGSRLLTDQGKYYDLIGSLDGYSEIQAGFERCTACHRRKPGSKKLTKKGEMFSFVVGDMEGLLQWMRKEHPGWPDPLLPVDPVPTDEGTVDKGSPKK